MKLLLMSAADKSCLLESDSECMPLSRDLHAWIFLPLLPGLFLSLQVLGVLHFEHPPSQGTNLLETSQCKAANGLGL